MGTFATLLSECIKGLQINELILNLTAELSSNILGFSIHYPGS